MFAKIIVLAFVAAFLQVDSSFLPEQDINSLQVQGIIDDATKLFEKLLDVVQQAVDKAEAATKALLDELIKFAASITGQSTAHLQEEFQKVVDEINKVKKSAVDAGVDIADCLGDKETELVAIPVNFGKRIMKCGTDKIGEGREILNNTIKIFTDALGEVYKTKDELTGCGSGFAAIPCVGRVMAKMGLQMVNIPVKITTQAAEAAKLFVTLHVALKKCALDTALQGVVDCQKLGENIVTCATDKINHHNQTSVAPQNTTTASPQNQTTVAPGTTINPENITSLYQDDVL